MVGKKVLVEWIGVQTPVLDEEEDEVEEEWPYNLTFQAEQIGKMGAYILDGYNQLGIEVRTGLDNRPAFISWNAVLQIELLE
jgi:hypothetical protein